MTRIAAALLGASVLAGAAGAQETSPALLEGIRLWHEHQYQEAYLKLKEAREAPFGRTLQVDYMLGTAACRLGDPEKQQRGAAFLVWIGSDSGYALDEESKRTLMREIALCQQRSTAAPDSLTANGPVLLHTGAVLSLTGKIFAAQSDDVPVRTRSVPLVPIAASELERRLVSRGDTQRAIAEAERFAPGAHTRVFDTFVISSASGHTDAQLEALNAQLEAYLRFYVARYRAIVPRNYIRVLLVPRADSLNQVARTKHGLDLDRGTIGYSFRDDLSIVAIIPKQTYGTLFHELFHLMSRSNFGDIPPWLDEGLAALYEVSSQRGDEIKGLPNWRGAILKRNRGGIPSIGRLLTGAWPHGLGRASSAADEADYRGKFDPAGKIGRPEEIDAVYAATARYLAFYLQEKGWLTPFYLALQSYSTSDQFTGARADIVRLLEQASGMRLAAIQTDFDDWLSQQVRRDI